MSTSRLTADLPRDPIHPAMRDLYDRLATVGYDPGFIRNHVLPTWWEDSLAANPINRAMAELTIARMLGFDVPTLHDHTAALPPSTVGAAKLKHSKGVTADRLAPAIRLAERTASWILPQLREVTPFTGARAARAIREDIANSRPVVELTGLVRAAWDAGVPVMHLAYLPKRTKSFDGLALVCRETPVIVLASRRDSPAWLAFHLAHELGHVFRGHVWAGQPPLVDDDLSADNGDQQEREANEFACEILTGEPRPAIAASPRVGALSLAVEGRRQSVHDQIDPGVRALFFARATGRWATAERALKHLGITSGAQRIIGNELRRHLPDELPETTAQFAALAGVDVSDAAQPR